MAQLPQRLAFYLDENIDRTVLNVLQAQKIEVTSPEANEMKSEASDIWLLAAATRSGYVMVTHDKGFHTISALLGELWLSNGIAHAGIICVIGQRSVHQIARLLREIHQSTSPAQMVNVMRIL